MAVEVNILSQKYFKQLPNGDNFAIDTTNFVANLAALVMNKIKLVNKISVATLMRSGVAASNDPLNLSWKFTPLSPNQSNVITIRNDETFDWQNEGFFIGDKVTINMTSIIGGSFSLTGGVVSSITSSVISITFSVNHSLPTDIINANIVNNTELTSLVYKYGLIENSDTFSTASLINDEDQGWYSLGEIGADLGGGVRSTTPVPMQFLGVPKSWVNGKCEVAYVSGVGTQIFEITHEFIIPYFRVGELQDLINDFAPDYLNGGASLKYVFEADFRTLISNPNTSKKKKVENVLGSVGWFGETFNGFQKNYEITSVNYAEFPTLNNADGVLISGKTKVTIFIKKLFGNFNSNDFVKVYFSYLPELQAEVENTVTDFETNFMYDSIRTEMGGAATTGIGILNNFLAITPLNSSVAALTFEVELTQAQKLRVTNENSFLIGVEVADRTIQAGNSDVVILKVVDKFDDSPDIDGLIQLQALNYPYSELISGGSGGFTDFRGYNEHGLAIKGNFQLNLSNKAFVNSFKALLVAHNSTTNSFFILDEYEYLFDRTVVNGVQQLTFNDIRNYQLANGSEKNLIKLELLNATPNVSADYSFNFAQKIRWEEWQLNQSVDNVFYNATKLNNNFNHKTSNYSGLNGFEIKMLYLFNVSGESALGVSGNTEYRFFSPKFTIFDYDKDGNMPPNFTQIIETFEPNSMTNLNGSVLVGQDTLFRITWTFTGGNLTDITPYWVIHRIEQSGETGQQIMEIGTIEQNETTNNLLKNITKSLVGGKLVTECLIDGNKTQSVNYNLSGEINSPAKAGTPTDTGENKTLNTDENKTLNTGEIKTVIL